MPCVLYSCCFWVVTPSPSASYKKQTMCWAAQGIAAKIRDWTTAQPVPFIRHVDPWTPPGQQWSPSEFKKRDAIRQNHWIFTYSGKKTTVCKDIVRLHPSGRPAWFHMCPWQRRNRNAWASKPRNRKTFVDMGMGVFLKILLPVDIYIYICKYIYIYIYAYIYIYIYI